MFYGVHACPQRKRIRPVYGHQIHVKKSAISSLEIQLSRSSHKPQ